MVESGFRGKMMGSAGMAEDLHPRRRGRGLCKGEDDSSRPWPRWEAEKVHLCRLSSIQKLRPPPNAPQAYPGK